MKNALRIPLYIISYIMGTLVVFGCAEFNEKYQPLMGGITDAAYQSNLLDCQRIAAQQLLLNPEAQSQALVGAGVGALMGSETGGYTGALEGAKQGATSSGATNAQKSATDACMAQRGYK